MCTSAEIENERFFTLIFDETFRGHLACSFLALVPKGELEDRLASAAAGPSWPAVIVDVDWLTEIEVK